MSHIGKLIILFLSMLFSNAVFSEDCEKLFNNLDKQNISSSDKDRQNKVIQMENDLFEAIGKCKTYSGMFVLMGELQIDIGQIPLAVETSHPQAPGDRLLLKTYLWNVNALRMCKCTNTFVVGPDVLPLTGGSDTDT